MSEVKSRPTSESFCLILPIQKGYLTELTEARSIFEPSIAGLASETITSAGLFKVRKGYSKSLGPGEIKYFICYSSPEGEVLIVGFYLSFEHLFSEFLPEQVTSINFQQVTVVSAFSRVKFMKMIRR